LAKFRKFSRACFAKRPGTGIPIFRHIAQLMYSYRYDSNAIDDALREAFHRSQSRPLFGSSVKNGPDSIKVGVISMSGEDNTKPCLLANYSRDWGHHIGSGKSHLRAPVLSASNSEAVKAAVDEFGARDYLFREESPSKELLTWQA